MKNQFTGHWLVSEYIYNSDGSFAGIVQQRRIVEPLANGKTRVIQHCAPQPALDNHPMATFKGEWVFELSVEGRARRYHGPDVIGTGLTWGEGIMTGRGVWPRFGHNFTSFAILTRENRQITGGKFYNAGEMIANIIGIAIPEIQDQRDQYPNFIGSQTPSQCWRGKKRIFDAQGSLKQQVNVERCYTTVGWQEASENGSFKITRQETADRFLVSGSAVGVGKQSGWLVEISAAESPEQTIEIMDMLDNECDQLISITTRLVDHQLYTFEIAHLHALDEKDNEHGASASA